MAAQLRPNRMAVTDRFPMLGFNIRSGSSPRIAEVVLATDPSLFTKREGRTSANFFSSRELGLLSVSGAEAVFMVPPTVLARFVGANRLWFGLATATPTSTNDWTVEVLPNPDSPYISLAGLSDRALRRVRMFPGRASAGGKGPLLEWAGDKSQPGTAPALPAPGAAKAGPQATPSSPAAQPATPPGEVHYDDGFGPLPPLHSAPQPPAMAASPTPTAAPAPAAASAALDWARGLDADGVRRRLNRPQPRALEGDPGDTDAGSPGADVPADTQAEAEEIRYALQDGQVNKVAHVERASGVTTLVFDWAGQEQRVPIVGIVDAPPGKPSTAGWSVASKITTLSAVVSYILLYACGKWGKGNGTEITYEADGKRWLAKKATHNDTASGGPRTSDHAGMDVYVAAATAMAAGLALQRRKPQAGALGDLSQAEQSQAVLEDVARSMQQKEGTRFDQVHYDSSVVNFGIGSWTGPRIATVLDAYEAFATGKGSTATLYGYFGDQNGFNDLRSRFRSNSIPAPMAQADKSRLESLGGDTSLQGAQVRLLASEVKSYADAIETDNKYPFIDGYMNAVTEVAVHVLAHATHQHGQVNDLIGEVIANHGGDAALGQEITSGTTDEHKFLGEIGEAVTRRVKAQYQAGVRKRYVDLIAQFEGSALSYYFHPQVATSASLGWARGLSDDPEAYGIEAPPYSDDDADGGAVAVASALSLGARDNSLVTRTAASPNFDEGRGGTAIDRIVIHIADVPIVQSVVNNFSNAASKVSAHYLVGPGGEVVQFVAEKDTAWHCKGSNRRSIGIEHIAVKRGGADYPRRDGSKQHFDAQAPTQLEYETSAALVASLCDKYQLPINRSTILGHKEADKSTGHTACPDGNWDWDTFMKLVNSRSCQPQSQGLAMARARALDADDWSVNWDDVQMTPQPTDMGCWATAAAMVTGWRDNQSVDPTLLARYNGMDSSLKGGLAPQDKRNFAKAIGLVAHPNACYTPDGFRQILEANGPIWVTAKVPGVHAIVVTGMYRKDGRYYVRITDPWDRIVGTPGAPGNALSTHTTGSRYIMGWDGFAAEFEAAGDIDRIQLLHSGGTFDHTINTGSAAGVGYALGTEPRPAADGFGPGVTLSRRSDKAAGCSYDLAQLSGLVQPDNALAGGAGQMRMRGQRIVLDDWPYIDGPGGRTSAPVSIDWAWQGGAVGDIAMAPKAGSACDGWTAQVRADISRAQGTAEKAGLKVRVTTTFRHDGEDDLVAVTEVILNGDGRPQICHDPDGSPQVAAAASPQRQLQAA
jgi:N-acetyl-anhydromuramyl-L-alanine amidase AmpD